MTRHRFHAICAAALACLLSAPAPALANGFDRSEFEAQIGEVDAVYKSEGTDAALAMLEALDQSYARSDEGALIERGRIAYEIGKLKLLRDEDEAAIVQLDRALSLYRAHPAPPVDYVVDALGNRSSANRGLMRNDQAYADSLEAVRYAERNAPPISHARQFAYDMHAAAASATGQPLEWQRYLRRALTIAQQRPDGNPYDLATIAATYVRGLVFQDGRAKEGVAVVEEVIGSLEERIGPSEALADLLRAYGLALSRLGEEDRGTQQELRSIAMLQSLQQDVTGDNAQLYISEAIARHNLAFSYQKTGRFAEAREQVDAMAAIMDARLPDSHVVHIFTDRLRALVMIDTGDSEEGLALLRRRYQEFAQLVPATELRKIRWQGDLARSALETGDMAEARTFYESALEGLSQRADQRRSDVVLSMQEWEGQRTIMVGYVETLAQLAQPSDQSGT
ncbi:hypothetical protein CD351_02510 [Erythrobacter sp. KY5]|uniref:hypothetical protein n=1 Tax=Erythrobacter sp. KY5 TaxID=2011159 RepID=UPI000DBEF622|nr:hypothetical protein [Erythrobacter sp. KY5]AWW73295.1 hypothetical protein CD351_02510 [Erythrobacter sp. KY5]